MIKFKNDEMLEVLPASIIATNELTYKQKVILAQLVIYNGLEQAKNEGFFYRSNKDLMNDCEVSEPTLITSIKKLESLGFIDRKKGKRGVGASEYRINEEKINDYLNSNTKINFSNNFSNNLSNNAGDNTMINNELINVLREIRDEIKELRNTLNFSNNLNQNFSNNFSTDIDIEKEREKEKEEYIYNNINIKNKNIKKENILNDNNNLNKIDKNNNINNFCTKKDFFEVENEILVKEPLEVKLEDFETGIEDNGYTSVKNKPFVENSFVNEFKEKLPVEETSVINDFVVVQDEGTPEGGKKVIILTPSADETDTNENTLPVEEEFDQWFAEETNTPVSETESAEEDVPFGIQAVPAIEYRSIPSAVVPKTLEAITTPKEEEDWSEHLIPADVKTFEFLDRKMEKGSATPADETNTASVALQNDGGEEIIIPAVESPSEAQQMPSDETEQSESSTTKANDVMDSEDEKLFEQIGILLTRLQNTEDDAEFVVKLNKFKVWLLERGGTEEDFRNNIVPNVTELRRLQKIIVKKEREANLPW